MKKIFFPFVILFFVCACAQSQKGNSEKTAADDGLYSTPEGLDTLQTAYFASGCFWCVEEIFEAVKGVIEVESGYAGGDSENPTYEDVSSGRTNHAEAVKVYYDSTVVSFAVLVDVFFNSHDPTTLNQQGPDKGAQYRSIAFYQNGREKQIIEDKIFTLLTEKVFGTIVTEVKELDTFYIAEDYHQNYIEHHPNDAYVVKVSKPRFEKFRAKMPEVLQDE